MLRSKYKEIQTHKNDVRKVKAPTKRVLANHEQGSKKACQVMFKASSRANPQPSHSVNK